MEYNNLVEQYKKILLDDPVGATCSGIHTRDHELSDLSVAYFQKELKEAKELLVLVNEIDSDGLDFDQQIDWELIKLQLEKIIFSEELKYNDLFDYEQRPAAGSVIINSLLYLFLKDPRSAQIRLDAITARLGRMPEFLTQYRPTLKKTIGRWKNIELEEIAGAPDLFANIVVWAEQENYSQTEQLKTNIANAKLAMDDYVKFINSLEVLTDFSIGSDKAQKLINLNGLDLTLEQVFQIAKDFFLDHEQKISALTETLKKKYNLAPDLPRLELLKFIKDKYAINAEEIVDRYKSDQEKVSAYIKKSDYFVFPESEKLIIMQTPSYLVPTIPVGAMFPPAPFEAGPKTSVVYLTVDEARRKDQNSLMITNTMIHEGLPGHHLQFSVAYENKSDVRKLANYNEHAEGWTTYLETFMSDVGFIDEEIKSEYLLIALSDFARLGARVAIDLYFLTGEEKYLNVLSDFVPTGDDVFAKAKSLLQKVTGFTDARVEGELNWYSSERGYPMCYLLGNRLVWQLQRAVLEKFGANKEEGLKLFHKTYLQEGIMPLRLLKKVFQHKNLI
jgi:uncharacterized protein (DUF885 family)